MNLMNTFMGYFTPNWKKKKKENYFAKIKLLFLVPLFIVIILSSQYSQW